MKDFTTDRQNRQKTTTPVFDSQDLFAGRREIIIDHLGKEYRLLRTRSGKLLLNK